MVQRVLIRFVIIVQQCVAVKISPVANVDVASKDVQKMMERVENGIRVFTYPAYECTMDQELADAAVYVLDRRCVSIHQVAALFCGK